MNTTLYRIFVVCLLTCALLVITMAWVQPESPPWFIPSIIITLFVTGFASFLLWFSRLFWGMYKSVTKKEY